MSRSRTRPTKAAPRTRSHSEAAEAGAEIHLGLRTLRRTLVAAIATLVVLGLGAELIWHGLDSAAWRTWLAFVDLSFETNLPTWFSSGLLLGCAALLLGIALAKRQQRGRYVPHWSGLAAIFAYMSLDEFVQLHEHMSSWVETDGILYFGWVIPAAAMVTVVGLAYLGFLRHLPARTRRRFLLAGALYVGGALVMELPLGWWTARAGADNLVYGLIDLVEEGMEMAGAALFLYALVEYLGGSEGSVRILLRSASSAPTR